MDFIDADTGLAVEQASTIPPFFVDDNEDGPDNGADTQPARKRTCSVPTSLSDRPKLTVLYNGMDQSSICSSSVEKTALGPMWQRWKDYCISLGETGEPWIPQYGLQLYNNRTDLQNSADYNHQKVDGFFKYLHDSNVGKTVMDKGKTFLNTHLKCEHHCRLVAAGMYGALVQVSVGKSLSVRKQVGAVASQAASQAIDGCEDIQAGLEQLIPAHQLRRMLLFVFAPVPSGLVAKMDPINRIIFGCNYNTMSQTSRRGEEQYGQRMIQRNYAWLTEIGFGGTGVSQIVTNKAKHNKEGWLEYCYTLPHMDPLRDSSSFHGLLLIQRHNIDNEPFPDLASNDYNKLFNYWTYPAARDRTKHIEPRQFGGNFESFFSDANIVCAKITHQPRFQAIQEMDRQGLSEPIQRRMTGHKGKQQTIHQRCYANNPPTPGIVQRAGGDPSDPKGFESTPFKLTPMESTLCDAILLELLPELVSQHKMICEQFDGAKTYKNRVANRLYTKKGMTTSMVMDVKQCIVMLASPVLDPVSYLLTADTRSLRQQ